MTPTFKRALQLSAALPILALAACGEGYEMIPYNAVPYEMERTAGTGVAYVLASMMPAKGVVEETPKEEATPAAEAPAEEEVSTPPAEEVPAPAPEPEAAKPADGDKVFHEKQVK
jgi:hypothetical protein